MIHAAGLALARRYVREAEVVVSQQRRTVAELRRRGRPCADDESLLLTFESALAAFRGDLKTVQDLR
ncbi:MAG TPA: hypothetical protein VHU23_05990 [Rhizomicrobium sp.]|jgi:hypothetical protein|nr:hypothetical protein [Rhizomicrobium sp.]